MPIYEYRCDTCGFQKEYLQKLSDPKLTTCPECGKETFSKMLTAAGFQLKGSGWYVTDFRDKGKAKDGGKSTGASTGTSAGTSETKTEAKAEAKTESRSEAKTEAKPAAAGSTPAAS